MRLLARSVPAALPASPPPWRSTPTTGSLLLPLRVAALTLLRVRAPRLRSGFWVGFVFGTAFMLVLLPWLQVIGVYAWHPALRPRGAVLRARRAAPPPPGPSSGCPDGRCGPRLRVGAGRGAAGGGARSAASRGGGWRSRPRTPRSPRRSPTSAPPAPRSWWPCSARPSPGRCCGPAVRRCGRWPGSRAAAARWPAWPRWCPGTTPAARPGGPRCAAVQGNVPGEGLEAFAERRAVLDNHVRATLRARRPDRRRAGAAARPGGVAGELLRHRPLRRPQRPARRSATAAAGGRCAAADGRGRGRPGRPRAGTTARSSGRPTGSPAGTTTRPTRCRSGSTSRCGPCWRRSDPGPGPDPQRHGPRHPPGRAPGRAGPRRRADVLRGRLRRAAARPGRRRRRRDRGADQQRDVHRHRPDRAAVRDVPAAGDRDRPLRRGRLHQRHLRASSPPTARGRQRAPAAAAGGARAGASRWSPAAPRRSVLGPWPERALVGDFGDLASWLAAGGRLSSARRARGPAAPTTQEQSRHDTSRPTLGRVLMVVPTYNERDNLEWIVGRVRAACPAVDVLVVDDGSPDGTGELADELAAADPQVTRAAPHREGGPGRGVPARLPGRPRARLRRGRRDGRRRLPPARAAAAAAAPPCGTPTW